jgi:hypothetical protein
MSCCRSCDRAQSTTLAEPNDAFSATITALASEAGTDTEATAALPGPWSRGLISMPTSCISLATPARPVRTRPALGYSEAARRLYPHLAPFANLPRLTSVAVACYGSSHRPLGLAAWTRATSTSPPSLCRPRSGRGRRGQTRCLSWRLPACQEARLVPITWGCVVRPRDSNPEPADEGALTTVAQAGRSRSEEVLSGSSACRFRLLRPGHPEFVG